MSKKKQDRQVVVVVKPEALPAPVAAPVRIELTFDAWWAMKQGTLRMAPEMKDVLRKHFVARGFMASGEFDKGLEDFGIRT